MRVILAKSEYWVDAVQQPYEGHEELGEKAVEVPDELVEQERAAYDAWRKAVNAVYVAAGHESLAQR